VSARSSLRRLAASAGCRRRLHVDRSAHIGAGVRIQVSASASARIGPGCSIGDHVRIFVRSGELILGRQVVLEDWVTILVLHSVLLGDHVRLRERAAIIDMRPCYEEVELPVRKQGVAAAGVRIGAHAVLAPGAVVETGARIAPFARVALQIPSHVATLSRISSDAR
jgi:acetyltransferase-like isoleucine patch superfamily enzyme